MRRSRQWPPGLSAAAATVAPRALSPSPREGLCDDAVLGETTGQRPVELGLLAPTRPDACIAAAVNNSRGGLFGTAARMSSRALKPPLGTR